MAKTQGKIKKQQLRQWFQQLNTQFFQGQVPEHRITFNAGAVGGRATKAFQVVLGSYKDTKRERIIYINPIVFLSDKPTYGPRRILYHQMCHYFVKDHGPEFEKIIERYQEFPGA